MTQQGQGDVVTHMHLLTDDTDIKLSCCMTAVDANITRGVPMDVISLRTLQSGLEAASEEITRLRTLLSSPRGEQGWRTMETCPENTDVAFRGGAAGEHSKGRMEHGVKRWSGRVWPMWWGGPWVNGIEEDPKTWPTHWMPLEAPGSVPTWDITTINKALRTLADVWELDGDLMRCRGCGRALIASREGEALHHSAECKHKERGHPWTELRNILGAVPTSAAQDEIERLLSERDALAREMLTPQVFTRLVEWLRSDPIKPAAQAFTAGIERQIAYALEMDVVPLVKRLRTAVTTSAPQGQLHWVACERCGGSGEIEVKPSVGPYDDPTTCAEICSACDGTGRFCEETYPSERDDDLAVPTSLAGQVPDGYMLVPKEPTLEVERSIAYAVAVARQGASSTPRFESPTEYDIDTARAWVRWVVAALSERFSVPPPRDGHSRDCEYVTTDGPAPCTCGFVERDCNAAVARAALQSSPQPTAGGDAP